MKDKINLYDDVLLVNKPLNYTSFQAVNQIKYAITKKLKKKKHKVGHAGTLDPLATGLLIVCIGKKTKEIVNYQGLEKEYTGTIYLGATTPSYDLETEVDNTFSVEGINTDKLQECAKSFIGKQEQLPPAFSAKKIDGKRAYDLARKGEEVKMKTSTVEIKEFALTNIALPNIDFRIVCSKGTYIRSIAHDFGKRLESGAHLTKLCRTRIGEYILENAITPSEWKEKIQSI